LTVKSKDEHHSTSTKLKSYIPILEWLPKYQKGWIRGDVIAALTVWALLVPEAMAYASIAGMPPEAGLYAAPLALLGYAIFGTSRHLNVGPSSTVALLSAAFVSALVIGSTEDYITATVTLAILTGIVLIVAGLFKLGVFADFLSKPVLGGFVIGLAIIIAFGQLDKLLGYEAEAEGLIAEIVAFIRNLDQLHMATLVVGLTSLALLFLIERFIPKLPGAITVLFLAIIASSLLDLESLGVHIVGDIPAGLPPLGLPGGITPDLIRTLLPGAAAVALVGFAESVAAARSYAAKFGYEVDASQELIALGAANVGAGLSQGFVVDGSLSKTAASVEAGAKSQMVSIIAAAIVVITIVALTPLFHNLPEATLGAIVIHAVWHLIDFSKLRGYRRIKKVDYWAAMAALLGVLFLGILPGLIMAVTVSLLGLLLRAKSPRTAILGKLPDENTYRSMVHHPDAETYPGLLIFRFDEDIFFANAPNFRDAVRADVAADPATHWVLVDSESIDDIDITAIDMLAELQEELAESNIDLRFARMKEDVREYLRRGRLEEKIGMEHFYPSIQDGVDAYLAETDNE
jgi:SulP family sulfate permease